MIDNQLDDKNTKPHIILKITTYNN